MADKLHFRTRLLALDTPAALSREMLRLEADKGGISIMAAKGVHRCILLEQIPTKAANLIKQEILARGGDLVTPWTAASFSAEVVDCIVMGNLLTLRSTISKLYRQRIFHLPDIADALQDALMRTTPGWLPVARQAGRQGYVLEETLDDFAGGRIPAGTEGRAKGLPSLAPLGAVDVSTGTQLLVRLPVAPTTALAEAQAATAAGAVLLYTDQPTPALADLAPLVAPATNAANARHLLAAGASVIHDPTGLAGTNGIAAEVAAAEGFLLLGLPAPTGGDDWLVQLHRHLDAAMLSAYAAGVSAHHLLLHIAPPTGSLQWQHDLLLRRLVEFTTYGRTIVIDAAALAPAGQELAAVPLVVDGGAHLLLTSSPALVGPTLAWANAMLRHDPGPPETKG